MCIVFATYVTERPFKTYFRIVIMQNALDYRRTLPDFITTSATPRIRRFFIPVCNFERVTRHTPTMNLLIRENNYVYAI